MILEVVQLAGAIVGLLTGGFVVYDQTTKRWPLFLLSVSQPGFDGERRIELRVLNRSQRLLLLRVEEHQPAGHFRLGLDDTTRSTVASAMGWELNTIVEANCDRCFGLMNPSDFTQIPDKHLVYIKIEWRFAQPFFSLPARTKVLAISKETALLMMRADDYKTTGID